MPEQTPEEAAAEFFQALNDALDSNAYIENVDPDKLTELADALEAEGWTITDRIVSTFTAPDGRYFEMTPEQWNARS